VARTPWSEHPRLIALRARWRVVDVAVNALEGFQRHRTGLNAALVSHYGFLSVFPLFLVATTVLGFVLEDRPDLQKDIIDSAVAQLPIVGQQISIDPSGLQGSTPALIIGLLIALWASLKAFIVLQIALDDVAEVPFEQRPNPALKRLHALRGIGLVGLSVVCTTILGKFSGLERMPNISRLLLLLAAAAINAATLTATYRWLCTAKPTWRSAIPAGLIGGFLFAVLDVLGTQLVSRAIANASPVYGTFASVIGLLAWMSLHATIALGGAELNRALAIPRQ